MAKQTNGELLEKIDKAIKPIAEDVKRVGETVIRLETQQIGMAGALNEMKGYFREHLKFCRGTCEDNIKKFGKAKEERINIDNKAKAGNKWLKILSGLITILILLLTIHLTRNGG